MTDKTRALLEQAKTLTEEERQSLAYEILQTIEGEGVFSKAQLKEIERRARGVLSGRTPPGDEWEVVVARLEKQFVGREAQAPR